MPMRTASTPAKKITAQEAAALVKSGDWLDYGACLAQPDAFDQALAARVNELSGVNIRSSLAAKPRAVLEADPEGAHFHWFAWHFSAYERKKADAGICHHIPPNLGEIADYYRRFIDPIDIVALKVRPADASGYFNFGPTNGWLSVPPKSSQKPDFTRDAASAAVIFLAGAEAIRMDMRIPLDGCSSMGSKAP